MNLLFRVVCKTRTLLPRYYIFVFFLKFTSFCFRARKAVSNGSEQNKPEFSKRLKLEPKSEKKQKENRNLTTRTSNKITYFTL